MAKEKKTLKFQMMMAPGEAEILDDWMFKNRVRSRAEAIRRLCQIGISVSERSSEIDRILNKLSGSLASISVDDIRIPAGTLRAEAIKTLLDLIEKLSNFIGSNSGVFVELNRIQQSIHAATEEGDIDVIVENMSRLREKFAAISEAAQNLDFQE